MNTSLLAANEFGFDGVFGSNDSGPQAVSPLQTIETQVSGRFYQHPGFALAVAVFATAAAIGYVSDRPVARVHAEGNLGPASAEGGASV